MYVCVCVCGGGGVKHYRNNKKVEYAKDDNHISNKQYIPHCKEKNQ